MLLPGKRTAVEDTPASLYNVTLQVTGCDGVREPLLKVSIAAKSFCALFDTGSTVSLVGHEALQAASEAEAPMQEETRTVRLSTGWSTTTLLMI